MWTDFSREAEKKGLIPSLPAGWGCRLCQHIIERGNIYTGEGFKCKAFPEEIPEDLALGEDESHEEPIPGDGGLLYKSIIRMYPSGYWRYEWGGLPVLMNDEEGERAFCEQEMMK